MKRNFLRLCLMLGLLSLNSCRQEDLLPEKETYNNSGAFQLTSKHISLDEAKHKSKLISEIEQVENRLKTFSKSDAHGKIVNYANGVSIDTDDVVYIEYGPYHTYTFKINRENAPADASVENLILSLEPDGTYKELVKTYNLTQNDWHELSLGNGIDLEGKTTTVEVAKGTYYQANAKGSGCSYQSQQVYQACCHAVHGEGNIGEWGNCTCTGSGLPKMYTIEILVCSPEPGVPTTGWVPTPSSPSAPTAGGEPLDGGSNSGLETNPSNPNTVEGAQEQLGGMPTLPNLLVRNDPCKRTQALLQKPNVKQGINDVKVQAKKAANDINEGEIGRIEKNDGTVSPADVSEDHHVTFNDISGSKGIYHSHTYNGAKIHSPADIYSILGFAAVQPNVANYGDAYVGMIGANRCYPATPTCFRMRNYVIRFSGTTADLGISFTDAEMKQFNKDYKDRESELSEKLPYVDFLGDELNHKGVEKLFFDTLVKMGLSGKVILQRVDDDGTVNNINLDANGIPVATPCPTT